ncbi:flagellar protein FlbB [Leptospira sp. 2 VSF19]|uniref:Flagellar protein FlbB n=1 Tax=Leptospira soteropolitanensis TaxID=2950025 RepID=A0AAW5VHV5_9LEPT|nr:flagellar protein FlbB [Leptospira soteropolitanensis]MCW7493928.1 flagellar protein FlbB [Leptospira soteropolitanensis]MCW7501522.1 flagellar protein FlbB [Leptospira soteropolitanensis]MCW7523716.1 flagellar protein FlbB [Leptospira soteropolitanensis]MCW7527579.1 flagellar protein FlbB [Leptospira soteropolitanensis]MCW7531433.1 flagellar protein FlbB [Leptospira soteropolitanensis]
MASVTDSTRSFFLIVLIFFLIAIGFFVFDYFQVINAEDYLPFLKKQAGLVNQDLLSPTELEKLEMEKAKERLIADREELEQMKRELEEKTSSLHADKERLEELKEGIQRKEKEMADKLKKDNARAEKVKVLANKVANMPPESARDMLINWPDYDIIEVFEQMDKDAEEEGRQTITTYLLTLFPAERRSVISNKWLDAGAKNVPNYGKSIDEDNDEP